MCEENQRIFTNKTPSYLKIFDLLYIRTILNLRANVKRFRLYCRNRAYL